MGLVSSLNLSFVQKVLPSLLLLSGDVELNPGPNGKSTLLLFIGCNDKIYLLSISSVGLSYLFNLGSRAVKYVGVKLGISTSKFQKIVVALYSFGFGLLVKNQH